MTLNGEMGLNLRLLNLVVSGAHCVKMVDKAITMDNLRLLCLVVNVHRAFDFATPTVKIFCNCKVEVM